MMDFRDVPDWDEKKATAYNVNATCPQKRIRVLSTQHLNDVIESLKPSNFLTELHRFMRACKHLGASYPNHEELGHIDEIRVEFWARYQEKYKTEIKPQIMAERRAQIRADLRRLGFL